MKRVNLLIAVAICIPFQLAAFQDTAQAENWSRFRGDDGSGISTATGIPYQWSDDENIAWKIDLPGAGASSVVSFEDRLYVAYYSGYGLDNEDPGEPADLKRGIICVEQATGKTIWDSTVPQKGEDNGYRGFVALHGYASSTPAIDETGVYGYFGVEGAVAFAHDGKLKWRVKCGDKTHNFGAAPSPILYKDLMIVNAGVESNSIIALRKSDGSEVWRVGEIDMCWSTPLLVTVGDGSEELVVSTKEDVRAYEPATGKLLWTCRGIPDYICPSVIAKDGVVYAIGGRKSKLLAIKAGGKGDVTDSHLVWEIDKGTNVPSAILHKGHLYWAHHGRGIIYCVDAKTGDVKFETRLDPSPGTVYASPVILEDRIFIVSRDKGTFVIAADPTELKLITHNKIESDKSIFNGSPCVANGRMFLRSDKKLYCISK